MFYEKKIYITPLGSRQVKEKKFLSTEKIPFHFWHQSVGSLLILWVKATV